MLRRAALRKIGHVLKDQPEFQQTEDVPDQMRELVNQFEKGGKPKTQTKIADCHLADYPMGGSQICEQCS
jgi:hypothetical protein